MNISKVDFKLFIGWLKAEPADKTYDYGLPWDCLITRYLKACGFENVSCNPIHFSHSSFASRLLPHPLDDIASGRDSAARLQTYGEALERAEAAYKKMYG